MQRSFHLLPCNLISGNTDATRLRLTVWPVRQEGGSHRLNGRCSLCCLGTKKRQRKHLFKCQTTLEQLHFFAYFFFAHHVWAPQEFSAATVNENKPPSATDELRIQWAPSDSAVEAAA